MSKRRGTSGRGARGGVMPFIDLLFILLFSLLAMSETRQSESEEPVRIRLPEVEPGGDDKETLRSLLVLEIDRESHVRVRGNDRLATSPAELDELINAQIGDQSPGECEVEIVGDTESHHGVSVAVLQHLRKRGFAAVTLLATGATEQTWGQKGAR